MGGVFDLLSTLAHLFHPRHSNAHRPKVLHPESFIFYGVFLLWLAGILNWLPSYLPLLPEVLGFSSSITSDQVIDQTNQIRRSQGLESLTYNGALAAAAQRKAENMLAEKYWAHVSPSGKQPWAFMSEAGYKYRVAGENLAKDFTETSEMIQAWMNSPTHRANVLNNRYTEIGVAVVNGQLNDYDTTLVVQMFGAPAGQPLAVAKQGDTLVGAQTEPTRKPTKAPVLIAVVQDAPVVETEPTPITSEPTPVPSESVNIIPTTMPREVVLASAILPAGQLDVKPTISPKLILEAVSLAAVLLLISTLLYDWLWMRRGANVTRMVGHNFAHIIYLLIVAILITLHKSGVIY